MVERPSEDVDLFTGWNRRGEFEEAVAAVVGAYASDGLSVTIEKRFDTFARLSVANERGEDSKVELSVDYRANEPVRMAIGPVLHPDDAVANKMGALFGRAQARDFIDVDGAITSGRFSRDNLLRLAKQSDGGFDQRMFADVLTEAQKIGDDKFAQYGVYGRDLDDLRARFADWRAELLAD